MMSTVALIWFEIILTVVGEVCKTEGLKMSYLQFVLDS